MSYARREIVHRQKRCECITNRKDLIPFRTMKLSLIIPCYNEQEAVPLFYEETTRVLSKMDCDYDLVFVNDGSKDNTLSILRDLAAKDRHVVYISFSRNFGKESAMYAGFQHADGDYVAVMDADLQDPPALLPQMLQMLRSGEYDSVATCRVTREGEPRIRSWFARMFYRLINRMSDAEIVDGARDFRLMRREMCDAIVSMGEYNRFSKGIFGWIGFRTYWLPYENIERVAGQTKWSFWALAKYAMEGIVNFSQIPLNLSSLIGILLTTLALVATIFIIIRRLVFGDPVAGWASLVCLILFIGGVQSLCIGILGQYLAKTYMETKHRPLYIISESSLSTEKRRTTGLSYGADGEGSTMSRQPTA